MSSFEQTWSNWSWWFSIFPHLHFWWHVRRRWPQCHGAMQVKQLQANDWCRWEDNFKHLQGGFQLKLEKYECGNLCKKTAGSWEVSWMCDIAMTNCWRCSFPSTRWSRACRFLQILAHLQSHCRTAASKPFKACRIHKLTMQKSTTKTPSSIHQ